MKLVCEVFRSPRREGMYLYVAREEGVESVPEELLGRFGTPEPALTLVLTPERKLARVSAREVMAAIETQGYYLQMPPATVPATALKDE